MIYYIYNHKIEICMKQVQISDRQSSFIFYLVHQGKNLLEYNNEPMLAIAMILEDYMGQYGIVWNRDVVEVAGVEPASY